MLRGEKPGGGVRSLLASSNLSKQQQERLITNTFKYIIVDTGAILFNEDTVHAIVGEGFKVLKRKIYSAGFCSIKVTTGEVVKVWGESDSLKIKSQPEKDQEVIADLFAPVSKIKYFGFSVKNHYNG